MTFGRYTAAWMHGVEPAPTSPIEVIAPLGSRMRSRFGLLVRHCDLTGEEIVIKRLLRATPLPRTLRDLCLAKPAVEVLVIMDAALRRRLINPVDISRYSQQVAGLPGAGRLRKLAGLAAPAESPMETRLRWLFITEGLPLPEVQKDLHDANGEFVARADLYYPDARLVIEFDGRNHEGRLVADDRRQNLLVNAGYRLLRFTSADLFPQPETVVSQVRGALASAPRSARSAQKVPKAAA